MMMKNNNGIYRDAFKLNIVEYIKYKLQFEFSICIRSYELQYNDATCLNIYKLEDSDVALAVNPFVM